MASLGKYFPHSQALHPATEGPLSKGLPTPTYAPLPAFMPLARSAPHFSNPSAAAETKNVLFLLCTSQLLASMKTLGVQYGPPRIEKLRNNLQAQNPVGT